MSSKWMKRWKSLFLRVIRRDGRWVGMKQNRSRANLRKGDDRRCFSELAFFGNNAQQSEALVRQSFGNANGEKPPAQRVAAAFGAILSSGEASQGMNPWAIPLKPFGRLRRGHEIGRAPITWLGGSDSTELAEVLALPNKMGIHLPIFLSRLFDDVSR
jgi:hypothetical protein